jgi:DHA1 family tetracycline resistance protein-like MFS transporter
VAAAFGLLNGLYGTFVLPESLPPEKRSRFAWKSAHPFGALKMLRAHPLVFGLALAAFLQRIAHDTLPTLLVLYTDYRYGWTPATVGTVLAAIGIGSMLVSALLTGRLVKRFGEWPVLTFGMVAGTLGFAIYGLAPSGALFLAGLPLISLWGVTGPAMQALMTARVGADEQGRLQGALTSVTSVAGMIAPLIATQTFAAGIGVLSGVALPGLPYVLAAVLVTSALMLALRTRRTQAATRAPVPPN